MLPRLQAEEKLDGINMGAIAAGNLDAQARMRTIGQLQRRALGNRFRAKKASAKDVRGMGIGVRTAAAKEEVSHG